MIGSKAEEKNSHDVQLHAKNPPLEDTWIFEEIECSMAPTHRLLVRMVVAKAKDRDRVLQIFRAVPIIQNNPNWNCVGWVKNALEAVQGSEAVGTSQLDWETVRDGILEYCEQKKESHRFDGKGDFDMTRTATYDLLEGRETIP
jgi:hypothetical protein